MFDKTGTITTGAPEVTEIIPLNGWSDEEILRVAASAERYSEHPLGAAVIRHAKDRGIEFEDAIAFRATVGGGVSATVDGRETLVGSPQFLRGRQIDVSVAQAHVDRVMGNGATAILVSVDRSLVGVIALTDTVKPGAADAVERLRRMGLTVSMITGDNRRTAEAVARHVAIDSIFYEIPPDGKASAIKNLQRKGKRVAMVGDGINDAPALAQADLGVAIGSGADVALEASDITLVSGDPGGVERALSLSRHTMRTIRQNLFWAFAYNALGIPIAAGVLYPFTGWLLSPMLASAAMALSSVSVVLNSLRLRTAGSQPTRVKI